MTVSRFLLIAALVVVIIALVIIVLGASSPISPLLLIGVAVLLHILSGLL